MRRRQTTSPRRPVASARGIRRLAPILASLALLGAAAGCGGQSNPYSIASQRGTQARVTGQQAHSTSNLIVKLKPQAVSQGLGQAVGARTVSSFPQLGRVVLGLSSGASAARALTALSGNPAVQYAEPDFRLRASFTPSDPQVGQQWGHKAIDVFSAWDFSLGDPGVVVAVVDTGVDLTHPDLAKRLVGGRTFVPGTASPADDNGHGTHVAGVIAAEINDGRGIAGVAPLCRLMPVKVLDAQGQGNTSDIVAGLLHAADSGARIINLSLGGGSGSRALEEAIRYANGKGSLVVAAMGNDGRNVQEYPAAYSGVVSVGATSRDNQVAEFSNYGPWISVSAPGDGIWSTMPTYPTTLSETDGGGLSYGYLSGTSMATPYVSGVAALVASLNPAMPPAAIKARLERTSDNLGIPGFDGIFGHGLINARRAVSGR